MKVTSVFLSCFACSDPLADQKRNTVEERSLPKGSTVQISYGPFLCSYDHRSSSSFGHCFQTPFSVFLGNSLGMGSPERDLHPGGQAEDVYHTVDNDEAFSVDLANRPPVPVPRPEASAPGTHYLPDNEPYISKGKYGRAWCSAGSSGLLSRNSLVPPNF